MSWINTDEAARRLEVKPATVYAYVSRGLLHRRRAEDGRGSLFDPAEVERLATRGRTRRSRNAELVIESAITAIVDDVPYYRGRAVTELASEYEFEDIATFLWTGRLEKTRPDWRPTYEAVEAAELAQTGLPDGTLPLERLQVTVPAIAATDPLRLHLEPSAVITAGQNLIAAMVESLPDPARGRRRRTPRPGDSIADRVWRTFSPYPPTPAELGLMRSVLVLLADHELAASTLAARVAASVHADPYAVVAAGLGVVSGALHGGAALGAETMLAEAADPIDIPRVIAQRLRRGERIPGLGHFVYKSGDPRATFLLDRIQKIDPGAPRLIVAEAVLDEARRRRLPEPNVDFALAAFARFAQMKRGAGEAIFAIARTAGWIAHALEEYAQQTRLRPRAVYVGPMPDRGPAAERSAVERSAAK